MRRVRYSVAMSLDGYIAGPNGEADWIVMDPELGAWFPEFYKQFDTFLLGRKTFLAAGGQGGGMFGGMRMVVVSTTLDPKDYPGVTIVSRDVREAVTALRAEDGKDIWLFGGGHLFRSLLEMGLVDSVEVGVIPVLLGGGIPLLPAPAARATLQLKSHRMLAATGTLMMEYAVKLKTQNSKRRTKTRA